VRLGVYSDQIYRREGERISTNRAFIRFVTSLPPRVAKVVVFGRLDPAPGHSPYELPAEAVEFVPLPFYRNVARLGVLLRSVRRSCATFSRALPELDAVWIFGPNPMALLFVWIARRRRTTVFLGVRQDYPAYIANRLPSRLWLWAVPVAHVMDLAFRRLARRAPAVVLGDELARRYRRGGGPVMSIGFSLVRRSELVSIDVALAKPWDGELRLLTVSRLHPEKNPLLLATILAALRARDDRWTLTVAGEGPLQPALEQRLDELGVRPAVRLLGEVPNGPELWELYSTSHAFLHVSYTEGLPQVLFEAQGAGLPIVATDVGGVGAALGGGSLGLLIRPDDPAAAVDCLERLAADSSLRERLIAVGLDHAATQTLEAQLDRVDEFFRRCTPPPDQPTRSRLRVPAASRSRRPGRPR
jgi:glycosyltransferase involved in cell wall biosynthesis